MYALMVPTNMFNAQNDQLWSHWPIVSPRVSYPDLPRSPQNGTRHLHAQHRKDMWCTLTRMWKTHENPTSVYRISWVFSHISCWFTRWPQGCHCSKTRAIWQAEILPISCQASIWNSTLASVIIDLQESIINWARWWKHKMMDSKTWDKLPNHFPKSCKNTM